MSAVPTTMTRLMTSKGTYSGMNGQYFSSIMSAVSSAVCSYIPMASAVNSTNIVTGPGAGTYTGRITGCIPSKMSALMMNLSANMGLVGRDTQKLMDAVSFGVCQTVLTTVMVQGSVIGGGPGTGQGKISNLAPSALKALIVANLGGKTLVGEKTQQIVSAIAFGICMHIMSASTVITTCIGTFTPPPVGPLLIPAAPGFGKVT